MVIHRSKGQWVIFWTAGRSFFWRFLKWSSNSEKELSCWKVMVPNVHLCLSWPSGDQESCRHSVDSQGSSGVPRKQMRLDHFVAATQQLDCGFDRHHYPPDSFSSTSNSKTEQVREEMFSHFNLFICVSAWKKVNILFLLLLRRQALYPLSLINSSLDEAKGALSSSGSAIGRNLTAHQSYTMVTGKLAGWPLTSPKVDFNHQGHSILNSKRFYSSQVLIVCFHFHPTLPPLHVSVHPPPQSHHKLCRCASSRRCRQRWPAPAPPRTWRAQTCRSRSCRRCRSLLAVAAAAATPTISPTPSTHSPIMHLCMASSAVSPSCQVTQVSIFFIFT